MNILKTIAIASLTLMFALGIQTGTTYAEETSQSKSIAYLAKLGLINADINPETPISKGAFVSLVINENFDEELANFDAPIKCYRDVVRWQDFGREICLAKETGILKNLDGNTFFKAKSTITYAEAQHILQASYNTMTTYVSSTMHDDKYELLFLNGELKLEQKLNYGNASELVANHIKHSLHAFGKAKKDRAEINTTVAAEKTGNNTPMHVYTNKDLLNKKRIHNSRCYEEFNTDSPSKFVRYKSTVKGATFNLPYNWAWGNEQYKLAPYDATASTITYGPLMQSEKCGLQRSHKIIITEPKNMTEVQTDINAQRLAGAVIETTLNGLTALTYESRGRTCIHQNIVVMGEKKNYIFTQSCHGKTSTSEEEFAYLKSIIEMTEFAGE